MGNLIIQGVAKVVLIWGGIAVRHVVEPDIAAFEFDPVKIKISSVPASYNNLCTNTNAAM